MRAQDWDERYAAGASWTDTPNRWIVQHTEGLPPGTAVDLAAGDGRHARWLAARGWWVLAADFSAEAVRRGAARGDTAPEQPGQVTWVVADATTPVVGPGTADLVVVAYLHLPPVPMARALGHAGRAVRPGGTVVVVGHDATNLLDGVGGPQDPTVLTSPETVAAALAGQGLRVVVAQVARRPVDGSRVALDTVVVARRPVADGPSSRSEQIPPGV